MKVYRKGEFPRKLLLDAGVDLTKVRLVAYGGTRSCSMAWAQAIVGAILGGAFLVVDVFGAAHISLIAWTLALWSLPVIYIGWFALEGRHVVSAERSEVRVLRVRCVWKTKATPQATYPADAVELRIFPHCVGRGHMWILLIRDSSGKRLLRLTRCGLFDADGSLATESQLNDVVQGTAS